MKYRSVVFIQDHTLSEELRAEFDALMEFNNTEGLLEFLKQWDYGEGDILEAAPWGSADDIYVFDNYIVSTNYLLGYAALTEEIAD